MTVAAFLVAALGGAIAALSGFGIGSLLTPLFAIPLGTKLAVAAVSVPHAIATGARFWTLRRHVDRRVLVVFGILSAAGGLAGALLHGRATSPALGVAFGALVLLAGISTFTGFMSRLRLGKGAAAAAGLASGFFGGLVGNQGGIRAAALAGFGLAKESFVATGTAVGLIVDAARLPVYLVQDGPRIVAQWPLVAAATAGVLAGTFGGVRLLRRIPEPLFRKVLAALLVLLGLAVILRSVLS